jgi:soluble lytic murein transglycosylase
MKFFFFLFAGGAALLYLAAQPTLWGPFVYPLEYRQSIKTYARARNLEPNLVAAVIFEESRFYAGRQSEAGARGLMQIIPATGASLAKQLGETDFTVQSLLEPDRNIRYGTLYLRYLLDKYQGNLDLALAAYNAGETNVDRWRREGLEEIPFAETRTFVQRVKRTKKMYDRIYGEWYNKE